MLLTLLSHSWKMFSRSQVFRQSLFTISLISFIALIFIIQLSKVGHALPAIVSQSSTPFTVQEIFLGFFLLLISFDFLFRVFVQELPPFFMGPYLHLPINRSTLANYWLLRSWFHPLNLYLFILFWPLANPATQVFPVENRWLIMLIMALFVALNQSLTVIFKVSRARNRIRAMLWLVIPVLTIGIYIVNTHFAVDLSVSVFQLLIKGKIALWITLLAAIMALQITTLKKVKILIGTAGVTAPDRSLQKIKSTLPGLLARYFPPYALYWDLEWKLIFRNRRSKSNIISYLVITAIFIIAISNSNSDFKDSYLIIIFMLAGGFGYMHLQYAFSWESQFFDGLTVRPTDIFSFMKAKYIFHLTFSTLQVALILPVLYLFVRELTLLYFSLFLYSSGVGYAFYFWIGILNPARMDPNKKSMFNSEGITGAKFLQVFLLFISVLIIALLGVLLPFEYGTPVLFGVTGSIFILFQNFWIRKLEKTFINRKYIFLSNTRFS